MPEHFFELQIRDTQRSDAPMKPHVVMQDFTSSFLPLCERQLDVAPSDDQTNYEAVVALMPRRQIEPTLLGWSLPDVWDLSIRRERIACWSCHSKFGAVVECLILCSGSCLELILENVGNYSTCKLDPNEAMTPTLKAKHCTILLGGGENPNPLGCLYEYVFSCECPVTMQKTFCLISWLNSGAGPKLHLILKNV